MSRTVINANLLEFPKQPVTPLVSTEQKEQDIRTWIANKESVCPYAPGLARFVHLPEIDGLKMSHVRYLAQELKAFYQDRVNGKRVGRWMLMPQEEWQTHEEAHEYSENVFWLLNAAYYHLMRDKKSVQAAMNRELPGFSRGIKGEILNPIVGKQPNPKANAVPGKSLFYSALSPLYKSKQFYRYSPHAILPLVYASEFHELKVKHPKVTETVTFEMAYGGLYESFSEELDLNLDVFRKELPLWGGIIDFTAEITRASSKGVPLHSPESKGCPASNLSYFRLCNPNLVNAFYGKFEDKLPILKRLYLTTRVAPKDIICTAFAGSGLYTIPDYY